MLHPNTGPGGSHSMGTASLISTHIAQLNFARHSITIHRTFLYPENKIHVMSTAGKRDELEAPMIFFSPIFIPLFLQLHAERAPRANNTVQSPQNPGLGLC